VNLVPWPRSGYDAGMWPLETLIVAGMRRRVLSGISGTILELGAGTGANLRFYGPSCRVVALEPDRRRLQAALRRRVSCTLVPVQASADRLPFRNDTFASVVASLLFCCLPEPLMALEEVRRVLTPGGTLLLVEHTRGDRGPGRLATRTLSGPWLRLSGGCHLDRDTVATVREAGLQVIETSSRLCGIFRTIVARRV